MTRTRAIYEGGWVGRAVHSYDLCADGEERVKSLIVVEDTDSEQVLLFVDMEGYKFRIMRKERVGYL